MNAMKNDSIMKTIAFFLTLGILLLISCTKDDFDMHDPDVDKFVSIVRDGNYFEEVGYELPDFTMKHIARLLYYSKDTSMIDEFPTNPLSSKYTTPKILNECLFWTIDGIRFANKYPSLEPCLIDTSDFSEIEGYFRLSGRELIDVADLYLNWYDEYKTNQSEVLRTKNIFENTTYRW
jgi:hypothetical protein